MPLVDQELTSFVSGLQLDTARMQDGMWHDQGSDNFHFGMPVEKGLWVRQFPASHHCEFNTIELYLLVRVDSGHAIREISTMVCNLFTDGSFEEIEVPIFDGDREVAREILRLVASATTVLPAG